MPERRQYSPELQREVVVPGHYERRISDQQWQVPPLPVTSPSGGVPMVLPGGERPPAELRSAP